jgi:hypothetical protein
MATRIREHIRSNVIGCMALFVALSGTAYAVSMRREEAKRGCTGRGKRVGGRLLLATVIAVLAGFATAAPASAIPGLERVFATSPSNSNTFKSVTATCPSGKKVVGAGAEIGSPVSGAVVIDDLVPNGSLTSVFVVAFEDDGGTGSNWYVRSYAICAFPPAGLQRVTATSPSNSSNKGVTAACPLGRSVFGTGGNINGTGGGDIVMNDIAPAPTLDGVTVTGREDEGGTTSAWSVTSYAICAFPPFGLHRATLVSASNSINKALFATCSSGFNVHGLGGSLSVAASGQVSMEDLIPNSLLTSAGVRAVEDETGTDASWSLRTYAICAE